MHGGSLWMGIDDVCGTLLAIDMNPAHTISGTTDWTTQQVVMKVPANAGLISIGVQLSGRGELRARKLSLTVLDSTKAPRTTTLANNTAGPNCPAAARPVPLEPVNLELGSYLGSRSR